MPICSMLLIGKKPLQVFLRDDKHRGNQYGKNAEADHEPLRPSPRLPVAASTMGIYRMMQYMAGMSKKS